jgi:glyoxylase-like metal-dependent hydrolase (beta-lactamase superfamily II)
MSSLSVRVALAAVCCALGLGAWSTTRQDPAQAEVRAHAAAGAVHMLEGAGGNIGVSAGADGVLIVDDQFAQLAPKIQSALDALDGAGKGAPRFVLNTHFHGDHTGSNAIFGRQGSIVAHENVRRRLQEGGGGNPPMEPAGLPIVTFAEGLSVHFNGEEVRVRHYPAAHTDGDSAVFFEGSKVAHLGDLFFNGRFPFVDLDSGGSVAGLTRAIESILAELPADAKVIPGHGPLASKGDLERYRDMLVKTQALVKEALAAGDGVQQMVSNGLLAEYESWSWAFVDTKKYLETLVRDQSGR